MRSGSNGITDDRGAGEALWPACIRRTGPAFLPFLLAAPFLIVIQACVSVDPSADFDETGRLIRERTGSAQVYDPRFDDEAIRKAIDSMVEDGLTVDESVRVALLGNHELQSLFTQVGVTRAELVQAGLPGNPSLGLSTRFPSGGGLANITVDLAQNILDLLLIPIRRKIAETRLEQARLDAARRAVELVFEVRAAAYDLLGVQAAEQLTAENLELVDKSLVLAQDRLQAGEGDLLDVELARSEKLDLQREALTLLRDRDLARTTLGRLLGLSARPVAWRLMGELPRPERPELPGVTAGAIEAELGDDDGLVRRALARRLEVRVADLEVQAAREMRAGSRGALFEGTTLGAELERPEAPPTLVGPTIELPLPIWHQNQARLAEAGALVAQRLKDYEAVADRVAADVRRAAAELRGQARLVRFHAETLLPQANRAVETARHAYEAGERDILPLNEAQRTLVDQRRAYVEALRRYATALAAMERAMGGSLPGSTEMPPPPSHSSPARSPTTSG